MADLGRLARLVPSLRVSVTLESPGPLLLGGAALPGSVRVGGRGLWPRRWLDQKLARPITAVVAHCRPASKLPSRVDVDASTDDIPVGSVADA